MGAELGRIILREKKTWALSKAALVLLLLLLGLIFINPAESNDIMLDRIVALIDKEVITWSDLYKAMEFELKDKVRDMSNKERLAFLKKYEKEFLEKLIEMKLQLMYAEAAHISISDREIDAAIEDIMRKFSLTKDQLKESLKKEGFLFDEYRKRMGEQLLLQKVGNVIVAEKAIVTDEEIARRANSSKSSTGQIKYKLRLILIAKKADKEEDLQSRNKAEDIYDKLMKGADFREMASKYSDDSSASSGGDLGFVGADEMVRELLTIVEKMNEGSISQLFVSPNGYNIVQLLEKRSIDTDDKLAAEVRAKLIEEKSRQAHRDWVKSLKEKRFIKIIL
ncbi:MAG: peptidylprolyl isomerase [Nitrospirae bacterium]|nr:peptidylprolyl isomerase [Nitrospirota bacterium]